MAFEIGSTLDVYQDDSPVFYRLVPFSRSLAFVYTMLPSIPFDQHPQSIEGTIKIQAV